MSFVAADRNRTQGVAADIYRIQVPMLGKSVGVNAYLVKTSEGCLLVDTGWDSEESFDGLVRGLADVGAALEDLRYIVLTHNHADHYGLLHRLIPHTHAKTVMHGTEWQYVHLLYSDTDSLRAKTDAWLHTHGMPEYEQSVLSKKQLGLLSLESMVTPDQIVLGGEHLRLGRFDFEVISTPGHSEGHICLYEHTCRILLSGDHVLPNITPSVCLHLQSPGHPLADYLSSLDRVAALPAELVLPVHGEPFRDFSGRVNAIKTHHEERKAEMLAVLDEGEKTAFEVASKSTWSTGGMPWKQLPPHIQRVAVSEALAHLDLLLMQGLVVQEHTNGLCLYRSKRM